MKILTVFAALLLCFGCGNSGRVTSAVATPDTLPHPRLIGGHLVKGQVIDSQTRCSHYRTELDIIAIRFKCCDTYYPCYTCHEEAAGHKAATWALSERDRKAILCGVCGHELTVTEYLACNNKCPQCNASFNPNCSKHYHLYFAME